MFTYLINSSSLLIISLTHTRINQQIATHQPILAYARKIINKESLSNRLVNIYLITRMTKIIIDQATLLFNCPSSQVNKITILIVYYFFIIIIETSSNLTLESVNDHCCKPSNITYLIIYCQDQSSTAYRAE